MASDSTGGTRTTRPGTGPRPIEEEDDHRMITITAPARSLAAGPGSVSAIARCESSQRVLSRSRSIQGADSAP